MNPAPSVPAAAAPTRGLVFLETFGCQMNELDSELVRGRLRALGYRFTADRDAAELVLFNTCSVREHAESRVLSRVGRIGVAKREGAEVLLGLIGCMAERDGERMLRRYPQIDFLCGPADLDRLPALIERVRESPGLAPDERIAVGGGRGRRSATLAAAEDDLERLDLSRAFDPHGAAAGGRSAYVRITRGCNKFCTYCVVPHTRGPEIHRPPAAIVRECRRLAAAGVIEVTLLGQTVNHYHYVHGTAVTVGGAEAPQVGPGGAAFTHRPAHGQALPAGRRTTSFADLLRLVHEQVPEIRRLRFLTSFPRDFGEEILEVMVASPRICRYLHAPAQSGSDRVLRRMNRGYTRDEYLEFVGRARRILPGVSIAGDVIVGFSGETEEDFQETRSLLRAVRFKNNFIFKYSPRPGTVAGERLPDDVPEEVKRRRNNELLDLQGEISAELHAGYVGKRVEVFVTAVSGHGARRSGAVELRWAGPGGEAVQMTGRTGGDLIVVFDLPRSRRPGEMVGRMVAVDVVGSERLLLRGRLAGGGGGRPRAVDRA